MLFTDLRKHRKLAEKRHPMFERNRFGKFFMYFMVIFWTAYFIFIGIMLAFMFEGLFPNMEPYHIMNQGLIYLFLLDFLFRFVFQKTPAQEIKPYLLLPVKKNRLIDMFLLQSGLNPYNLFWLTLIIPFALITLTRFYGITGILCYSIGIWLLIIMNNYWYLLCRTLINEKTIFILLPLLFYGVIGTLEFTFGHPIGTFTMNLGESLIEGNLLSYTGILCAIFLLAFIDRRIQIHYIYNELSRNKDTKMKHVSEYKFLEHYGEIGEYLRLELKLLFRNKKSKTQFRMGCLAIIMFTGLLFTGAYSGVIGKSFVLTYNFAVLGILMLTQLMSFEGNYLDGLMSRKESIYSLLMAKYYFYSIMVIIPFLLMIPAIVMEKITLLAALSYAFFTIGFIYFMLFQMAVYNKKTMLLNENITGKNSGGTFFQGMVSTAAFFLPMFINTLLAFFFSEETAQWVFLITGIILALTSRYWIKNIYYRFMKRRYVNMEGFRDSR